MKATKLTESFDKDFRKKALDSYLNIGVENIRDSYRDEEFETDEGDFLVVTQEEAEELAKEDVENFIDELGITGFTPDFQDWIMENALDTDWFDDAERESYEYYVEDIESEGDDTFENRLIQELYDEDILSDENFEVDEEGNPDYTKLKDDVDIDDLKEQYVDHLMFGWTDSVEWFKDNFGKEELNRVVNEHNLVDVDAVAEEVIEWDGVANSLAGYDGKEIELPDGLFAYRTN